MLAATLGLLALGTPYITQISTSDPDNADRTFGAGNQFEIFWGPFPTDGSSDVLKCGKP